MIGVFCSFTGHPTDDLLMAIECSFLEELEYDVENEESPVDFMFERLHYEDTDVVLWVYGDATEETVRNAAAEMIKLEYIQQVIVLDNREQAYELLGKQMETLQ